MKAWLIVAALAAGPIGAHAQDANLARALAATCANCHGTNGNARGDMKPLAGQSADTIIALVAATGAARHLQRSCIRSPRATPTIRSSWLRATSLPSNEE